MTKSNNDIKSTDTTGAWGRGAWEQWTNCHTGNTILYTHFTGAKFMIAGWTKGAIYDWNTHIIDLTGLEHRFHDFAVAYDDDSKGFLPFINQSCAGWLSLPFPDYGIPTSLRSKGQWEGIKDQIVKILDKGTDVLVACHGGHGRSGLFCAIIGYMLNINKDRSWSSPVEKIRQLHCDQTVETYTQEKYVYDILGLSIQVTHQYVDTNSKKQKCPICGIDSFYVESYGMCLNCKEFYQNAPERDNITLADIEKKVFHKCNNEKCVGIWKANVCGHVVHDKLVIDGFCQNCYEELEARSGNTEEETDLEDENEYTPCAICERRSIYGKKFGVCWDCQQELAKAHNVDDVHNTITDPYRAVPHHCEDVACVGIVAADVCGHIVHNKEIEDGLCPWCREQKGGK